MAKLIQFLLDLIGAIFSPPAYDMPPQELPMNQELTNREKLLEAIRDSIGSDASPGDKVSDEFGCAESASNIIKKVYPNFRAPILSTKELVAELDRHPECFERTTLPKPGCIIISPRTDTTTGHAGFFVAKDRIVSNDSATGLMQDNYSWSSWVLSFKDRKGLRIYIWEPL